MAVKLFMVLYVAGKIGGTWGPLPYDMDECVRREAEVNANVAASFVERASDADAMARWQQLGVSKAEDVRFACEMRSERPALAEDSPPT